MFNQQINVWNLNKNVIEHFFLHLYCVFFLLSIFWKERCEPCLIYVTLNSWQKLNSHSKKTYLLNDFTIVIKKSNEPQNFKRSCFMKNRSRVLLLSNVLWNLISLYHLKLDYIHDKWISLIFRNSHHDVK